MPILAPQTRLMGIPKNPLKTMSNFEQAQAAFNKMRSVKAQAQQEYEATLASLGWVERSYGSYDEASSNFYPSSYTGGFSYWGPPLEEGLDWSPLPAD